MAIFGNTPSQDTGKAMDALQQAQQAAASILSPYTNPANQDFNNARNYLYGSYQQMGQYGNPAGHFYEDAGENPEDLLNQIMGGYTMSEGAQNQMKNSLSAANNMATTTGMYGSGDDIALNAEIANEITGQDQQQYLKNVAGVANEQQKFIQDFMQQMQGLNKAFGGIINKEYGASGNEAGIDKSLGQNAASIFGRESGMPNHQAQAIGTILGGVLSAMMRPKK